MTRITFWRSRFSGVVNLSIALMILFVWSCGDSPTMVQELPEAQEQQVPVIQPVHKSKQVNPVKKLANASKFDGTSKSKTIKADKGGKVKHRGHEIYVPAGAIAQDETFSITILSTAFMDIEFKPDGSFFTPVELTISYEDADLTGISEDELTIAWYDPDSGIYYDVGGEVDKKKKYLKVWVSHFTRYSLSVR